MYRIDGIYNSGYAHAPALIVNPSGSYPLIYNSTTGILQQTPNDQKVDKASEVEFTSVKTGAVKSTTGTDAVLIDSSGSIFAQNGLWSEKGVQISDLSLKKITAGAYEIKAIGVNDKLAIYSPKGVSIGFANNNFLFEPANMLFQGPSFRIPSGASMWTSKIDSATGQSAITIADNGTVSIPSLTLPSTGVFKQLVVNNLPNQSGQLFIEKPYNDNSFYIRSVSEDNTQSLAIYATSIRNRDGSGGFTMDNNISLTTFLAQVNNFTSGVYVNNNIFSDNIVNRLWYEPNVSTLNLTTTGSKLNLSSTSSKVELSGEIIYFASKVGTAFTNTAAFSSAGIDFFKSVSVQGLTAVSVDASAYKLNGAAVSFPNQAVNTTSSPSFVSVNATDYKLNGAAVSFPNQALNTTSTPTFAGLTTTPVLPSVKAPILTNSTDGASTNSNPNGNGADLDVYDLRIRSGRLFTTAATLQLGKKFSCDKQFNITGNNASTTGETPYVTLRGAVQLQIGTTNYPSAILVSDTTGIVSIEKLQLTNSLYSLKAPGGVEGEFFTGSNVYANKWSSNPGGTSVQVEQAVATSTGPNFTGGIRVNNIKRPDGTQTYIDMSGTRPSFPLGLDATLNATSSAPYIVTYDSTTKALGYATTTQTAANIRFAMNYSTSYINSSAYFVNTIQTYYVNQPVNITPPFIYAIQLYPYGYPPLVEASATLVANTYSPNVFVSFKGQTPFESTNFPNTWENNVCQKFPALGSYMITWNNAGFYDARRVLISINKNFPLDSRTPAGNDPTCLSSVEYYVNVIENGVQITALVNITSLSDYVTYTYYNFEARTFISNQGRRMLSIVKVG
jgi:hypothetical protein